MKISQYVPLLLIFFLSIFGLSCIKPVEIKGSAMQPTLNNGDKIFISTDVSDISRRDVISFLHPKNTDKWYIKRIIGLPNETVEIKNGKVFINGNAIDEPYIDEKFNKKLASFDTIKVPEDNYFVLGDNRDNSSDSRFWGTVPKSLIKGTYWYKYAGAK